MFHAEKAKISLVDRIAEVTKEMVGERADGVEPQTENQLDVGDGCRPMPHGIIEPGEPPTGKPTAVSGYEGKKQSCQ